MRERFGHILTGTFGAAALAVMLNVTSSAAPAPVTDDQDIVMPCPPYCKEYEYGSWQWLLHCSMYPRKCSANPEETLRTPPSKQPEKKPSRPIKFLIRGSR